MSQKLWTAVDDYLTELVVRPDPIFQKVLAANEKAGLPPISVSFNQGKLLYLLARLVGAKKILEMGALGGFSTIWLAKALPAKGKLITLEADPDHAKVARANTKRAKLDNVIELRLGKALDTLPNLLAEKKGPFDLIFIDADKPNIYAYFEWALKLARRGSLIVIDNVVRGGEVIDGGSYDPGIKAIRRLNKRLSKDRRVEAAALQTVGVKGYDGLLIAVVK
jgi:predicted O-methyltransferase YrrM